VPRKSQEIAALRRQNRWYIEDDPIVVQLTPYPAQTSAAGGVIRRAATPRMPQRIRLIPADRERTTQQSQEDFGSTQTEVELELIGDADLIIEVGDRFTHDNVEYQVTQVQPVTSAPYIRRATAFAVPDEGQ
jgi:hypothetical protein